MSKNHLLFKPCEKKDEYILKDILNNNTEIKNKIISSITSECYKLKPLQVCEGGLLEGKKELRFVINGLWDYYYGGIILYNRNSEHLFT